MIIKKKYYPYKNGQSGGASEWRVCYQRGLPRLLVGGVVGAEPQFSCVVFYRTTLVVLSK